MNRTPTETINEQGNQTMTAAPNDRIARILSGSCTPACDLEAMIESGEITLAQASNALQTRMGAHRSVAAVAQAERDDMRARDC